jgi:hypothetical protein
MIREPTEFDHYRDVCSACDTVAGDHELSEKLGELVTLSCTPHDWKPTANGGRIWYYRCPVGHEWTCFYAVTLGYFSDCMCGYCVESRKGDGAKTYPRSLAYNDPNSRLYKIVTKTK